MIADAPLAGLFARARARVVVPVGRALPAAADLAPTKPLAWLRTLFPRHVQHAMADRHVTFWRWVWPITLEDSPDPFVAIWPRGGAKSTSAELAVAALGTRDRRRYALYVRGTQERADDSVSNIAGLLESDAVARFYPQHADRKVGKHGNPRGWRRNRVWTAGGFVVDAIGLDTAGRGVKLDEQRPDLIIFDDIDEKHDRPGTTERKIATITTSLLPAGASNAAVLAIQNLIIPDGFFTRLADGRADYLARRIVSGPFPAVEGLVTEPLEDTRTGITRHVITAGTATWAGQSLGVCQRQIDEWGVSAFRKEAQHEVTDRAEGLALRVEAQHVETLTDEQCRALVKAGQPFGGIDFGAWRFAFVLRVPDADGRARQIAEYFSQRESLEHRARAITAIGAHYGVPAGTCFVGDAANPTDILELELAFQRIGSAYHVAPVAQANKARRTSVERITDLLGRRAITYRRDVHRHVALVLAETFSRPASTFRAWRLGMGAGGMGVEMQESRLAWELAHWSYPVAKPGESQDQDPDDHTADGADLIAADRYAIMTWWRPAPVKAQARHEDQHPGYTRTERGMRVAEPTTPARERVFNETTRPQRGRPATRVTPYGR